MKPMPQQQPQSQYQPGALPLTLAQAREIVPALMQYPALTVMVFFRRRIGYRVVRTGPLIGMALLLIILPHVLSAIAAIPSMMLPIAARPPAPPSLLARLWAFVFPFPMPSALTAFALAMAALGFIQHRRRWKELLRGERWHTRSRGISPFEGLVHLKNAKGQPYLRLDMIYRHIDPVVCFIAGWMLMKATFTALGLWVMFSAFALRIVEQHLYDKALDTDLDTLDSLIESEIQTETVEHFEGAAPERSIKQTAGIPTGAGADLEARIKERKARAKAATAP